MVNNAGASRPGRFETLTDEAWQGDMDVKLFSQIRCSRATLPPHVRASSAACLNFSKVLAIELGPENILVNSVDIGFVLTPQWENIRKRRSPEDLRGRVLHPMPSEEVPLGRFGGADEVSGIVAFLASDRASYLTGTSIDVAGALGKYV